MLVDIELDIHELLLAGKTNYEISNIKNIEVLAVENYIKSIYKKQNVKNRIQAVIKNLSK